jgi:succinyl-CoA synthetase alpha subunit
MVGDEKMAILLDENTSVLIQGITGREGTARARFMLDYGTRIVAGVTPGRGGTEVWHIPVYNTVEEACRQHKAIDASVTFVPGPAVKEAIVDAITAGIRTIIMPVERVPLHDILEIVSYAKEKTAKIIGPGSIGLISPGKAVAGWIGGTEEMARRVFRAGTVGVISRSGGQTTTVCWALTQASLGQSTAVHVGSEPIVGMAPAELLPLFQEDEQTEALAFFGEIGTVAEEEAAEVIKEGAFKKPVVAYISGVTAQPGVRFSHASAIIERGRGSAESKMKALKDAGVQVVDRPEQIAPTIKTILRR